MKKIVIIGANDFQNPLILKAKEMGYETHVFAWQDGSIGEKTADFFYPISIVEKDLILEECKKIQPDAVVTIASDLANITVQYLQEKLDLPHNSKKCIDISTNKYLMRCAFKENNVNTPYFAKISSVDELDFNAFTFPVIVKPTDRSGSRGITKVYDKNDLAEAIKISCEQSFEKMAVLEEYIEGLEYSCESISFDGTHTMLTVTKKFTTGAPHFIETGHMEPAPLSEDMLKKVKDEIFKGLDALEIRFGASHAEFRITSEGEVRIIEIGSRMGGDCIGSDLVYLSTGYDFVKMVIDTACGKAPDLSKYKEPGFSAIRFVFEQKDVDILNKIKEESPESLYFVSDIEPIGDHKIVDSGTRYGFYILVCDSFEKLMALSELKE